MIKIRLLVIALTALAATSCGSVSHLRSLPSMAALEKAVGCTGSIQNDPPKAGSKATSSCDIDDAGGDSVTLVLLTNATDRKAYVRSADFFGHSVIYGDNWVIESLLVPSAQAALAAKVMGKVG